MSDATQKFLVIFQNRIAYSVDNILGPIIPGFSLDDFFYLSGLCRENILSDFQNMCRKEILANFFNRFFWERDSLVNFNQIAESDSETEHDIRLISLNSETY